MTTAQSLYRKFGALSLPISADTATQDASRLDPARDILLDLFAAALVSELEPVWARAVAGSVLGERDPVAFKLPSPPIDELLKQVKTDWPMLCVARSPEPGLFSQHGFYDQLLTQRWDVDYILCPLASVNLLRVQDVLQAVGKIVAMVVGQGGHKAYRTATAEDGTTLYAANVLGEGDDCCGFYSLRVVDMKLGPAGIQGDTKYYACGLTLESRELTGDRTGEGSPFGVLQGADYDLGIGGTPEGVIPGLLYASTDPPLQRG